jgi:bifunctional non-homologous end joining protein LigD
MPTTLLADHPGTIRPGGLPDIQPIIPVHLAEPFDDAGWLFEPKYEGVRGLVYSSGLDCEIQSAAELPSEPLRDLCGRVRAVLGGRETIIDGEVVALNRQGKPGFPDLVRGQGYIAFAASDLLWLGGKDLRARPLSERKLLLNRLLPEDTGPLYKVLVMEEFGRALYGAIRRMDLKGVLAKRKADPYGSDTIWYQIANPGYTHGRPAPPASRRWASRAEHEKR